MDFIRFILSYKTVVYIVETTKTVLPFTFILTLFSLFVLPNPIQASEKVQFRFDAATRFQAIESEQNGVSGDEGGAFGTQRANLHAQGRVGNGTHYYLEAHVNPTTSILSNSGDFAFNQGYITFTDSVLGTDFRLGAFEVNYGSQLLTRSDNGQVMRNPLVGNHLVDPISVQTGLELSSQISSVNWSLSLTNGGGDPANQIANNGSLAITGKLWGKVTSNFSSSLSFYQTDQSGSNGVASTLFGPSANVYQSLNFSAEPSQIVPIGFTPIRINKIGAGQDISATQLDIGYHVTSALKLKGYYGTVEDKLTNDDDEWSYYNGQARYQLSSNLHGVVRYGILKDGAGPQEEYDRMQAGFGYDFNENSTGKIEYVNQTAERGPNHNFSDEEFSGYITEVGITF